MMQEIVFPISSASRRILSKFFDYLLVIAISILINFFILYFSFEWEKLNVGNYDRHLFSGLFTLSMIINLVVWFIYFIVIPRFCNGKTLFSLFFKIKLYWENDNYIFSRLIKHEGISVLPIYFLNILIALVSFAFDSPTDFISSVFTFSKIKENQSMEIASSVLFVCLIIASLFLLGVIINIVANKNKSSYLDDVCEIYVIHLEQQETKKEVLKQKNNDLPGRIDEKELEEF